MESDSSAMKNFAAAFYNRMEVSLSRTYVIGFLQRLNNDELRSVAFEIGLDPDSTPYPTRIDMAREISAYVERRDLWDALTIALEKRFPDFSPDANSWNITSIENSPAIEERIEFLQFAEHLRNLSRGESQNLLLELTKLRQELAEVKAGTVTAEEIDVTIDAAIRTTNRAIDQTDALTARILLPPSNLTDRYLVPSDSLERLEEYRSDESLAYLLVGLFAGACLGIIANWVATDPLSITIFSLILFVIFAVLSAASAFWARRIHLRSERVKTAILTPQSITDSLVEGDS